MKHTSYFFRVIVTISCLGQSLDAAEMLKKELTALGGTFINLKTKLEEVTKQSEPPTIPKKPTEPSDPVPKFTKQFRLEYARDIKGSLIQVRIGLVADGAHSNLVVYGPKLINVQPQDFIIEQKTVILGEAPKTEQKLTFPVDKATNIVWNPDNKIIQEGPLASFILVKETDYKEAEKVQKQAENDRDAIRPDITQLAEKVSTQIPTITEATVDEFVQKLLQILNSAETLCKKIQADPAKFVLVLNETSDLIKKTQSFVNRSSGIIDKSLNEAQESEKKVKRLLEKQQKGEPLSIIEKSIILPANQKDIQKRIQIFINAKNKLDKAKTDQLTLCFVNIDSALRTIPSLENVLYKFYKAYLDGTPTIADWWVTSERKVKPITPTTPPPSGEVDLVGVQEELENAYEEYKKKTVKERENFMQTKTKYSKTIKDLLAYFIQNVPFEDRDPRLTTWNQYVQAENYTWPTNI